MSEAYQGREGVVQYPKLAVEILARYATDQDMRSSNLKDDSIWDENVDRENTERMRSVIAEIGWPTISKVGKEAAHAAWTIVQHADHDSGFQEHCLSLMKAESPDEVEVRDTAFLEDRVRVNTGRLQLYGTQFHETRDAATRQIVVAYGPQPIEDIEHIDERRASVGLGPFKEHREGIIRTYYPHLADQEG
ncbi:MAG: DUF6624 domain-containing protein [Patescibacteria group bacterium]